MADNYLERKMEDLRNGKYSIPSAVSSKGHRKGIIQFDFPPKRILVISDYEQSLELCRAYVKSGSKVAWIESGLAFQCEKDGDEGIRHYITRPKDQTGISHAFTDLLKAWRDVDIVVADSRNVNTVVPLWEAHRAHFPYVSDYISRLIIIGDSDPVKIIYNNSSLKATINVIVPGIDAENIIPLIQCITLPANHIIDNIKFELR